MKIPFLDKEIPLFENVSPPMEEEVTARCKGFTVSSHPFFSDQNPLYACTLTS